MYDNDTKDANKIAINDDSNLDIINLKVVLFKIQVILVKVI